MATSGNSMSTQLVQAGKCVCNALSQARVGWSSAAAVPVQHSHSCAVQPCLSVARFFHHGMKVALAAGNAIALHACSGLTAARPPAHRAALFSNYTYPLELH